MTTKPGKGYRLFLEQDRVSQDIIKTAQLDKRKQNATRRMKGKNIGPDALTRRVSGQG